MLNFHNITSWLLFKKNKIKRSNLYSTISPFGGGICTESVPKKSTDFFGCHFKTCIQQSTKIYSAFNKSLKLLAFYYPITVYMYKKNLQSWHRKRIYLFHEKKKRKKNYPADFSSWMNLLMYKISPTGRKIRWHQRRAP